MKRALLATLFLSAASLAKPPDEAPNMQGSFPPTCNVPPPVCQAPTHLECTQPPPPAVCPLCQCQMPPHPVPEKGTLTVRYYPTHIVYAPPGRSSSIGYSSGTAVGTTVTIADEHQVSLKVTATVGFKIPMVAEAQLDVAVGNIWGNTKTDALDIAVSRTTGWRKPGNIDGIDHDEDEVWFLALPQLAMTATPASYWGPADVTWMLEPDQRLEPYFLYVGELRGTKPIPKEVQANLDRWGFEPQDLASLLSGDALATGTAPNQTMDPARYEFIGTFPYRPPYSANSQPETQTLELDRKETNSSAIESKNTFTVDASLTAGANFTNIFYAKVKIDQGIKIITSTNRKASIANDVKTNVVVGQPSYGYTGPTVLRVYEDKMFKTFVFALDWY